MRRFFVILLAALFLISSPVLVSSAEDELQYESTVGFYGPPSMIASGIDISPNNDFVVVVDTGASRLQTFDTSGNLLWQLGHWGNKPSEFDIPRDAAVDSNGFIYVADMQNGRIQKFDSAGNFILQFSGSSTTNSELGIPMGIEIDSQNVVWVADTGRDRILTFDTNGNFTGTIIDGSVGSGDRTFNGVRDVTADDNFVYVADTLNDQIDKFTRTGTFVETWKGSPADFGFPYGVVADNKGHLYVLESGRSRVDIFNASNGALITSFGVKGTAPGQLDNPRRVAVGTDGKIYVADMWGFKTEVFAAFDFAHPATPVHLATWGGDPAPDGGFTELRDIAVAPDGGIFGLDGAVQRVQRFTSLDDGGSFVQAWGLRGSADDFGWPEGIQVDPFTGNVFISDTNQDEIQVHDPSGTFIKKFGGTRSTAPGLYNQPLGLAFTPDGNFWVADTGNNRIQKIDVNTGNALVVVGTKGSGNGQLNHPNGLALDQDGNVYVADQNNNRVVEFSPTGAFIKNIGLGRGTDPGKLKNPRDVIVAPWGEIIVADTINNRLSVFDSSGTFLYTIGGPDSGTDNNHFNGPSGLAFDAEGRLYVADDYNGRAQVYALSAPAAGFVTFTDKAAQAGVADSYHSWGIQWTDYDLDGHPDVYSGHHAGVPTLYKNNANGTFTDVANAAGLVRRTDRLSCAWGDLSHDGYPDLFCGVGPADQANELWKNNGNGTFSEIAAAAGVGLAPDLSRSVNLLDYDGDGWLDIFVGNSLSAGTTNRLLKNNGNMTFTDVSAASGLGVALDTQGSSWADCNNDGWPDLGITLNTTGTNDVRFYKNNGNGTFTDVTNGPSVAGAIALAWGDYNNDGLQDVYVASSRPGKGKLLRNTGDCTFVAESAANVPGMWSKDATWGDFDNDGDLDLFVTNKVDTSTQTNVPDNLYRNDGGGVFTDVAGEAGTLGPSEGRGDSVAWADYDEDGDLDIFVTNGRDPAVGPNFLYQNNGNANHWLQLRLTTPTGGAAYGASVRITVNGTNQYRQLTDGIGAYGQNEQILQFGLGSQTTVSQVDIVWPDGSTKSLTNVAADQVISLAQEGSTSTLEVPVFQDASTGSSGIPSANRPSWGVQWADFNSDGLPDLYYGRHQGFKASLYRTEANGKWTDVGDASGITADQDRHGCVWADFDADQDIDLYCTGDVQPNKPNQVILPRLFSNDGDGTFTDIAPQMGFGTLTKNGRSATALDYNNDGLLDIFQVSQEIKSRLFRNSGGWPAGAFQNRSGSAGITGTGDEMSRTVSSADYDEDGNWDLLDLGKKIPSLVGQQVFLFHNNGDETFTDRAVSSGLVLNAGNAGTWGDYDNDGDVDLFVGGWIEPDVIAPLALMRNNGDGTFTNVTVAAGIAQAPARMGVWGDFNNDGWLDLFVVNGMTAAAGQNVADQLYLNEGDGTFTEDAATAGLVGPTAGGGDAAAWADYNRDGSLDLAVANGSGWAQCTFTTVPSCVGPAKIYENTPNDNNWLEVRVQSTRDFYGYGSKVWATAGSQTQYRQVTDQEAGNAQNEQIVHFGLGSETRVQTLTFRWPDGTESTLNNVPANQLLTVVQP
jgi:streptogramin lyase